MEGRRVGMTAFSQHQEGNTAGRFINAISLRDSQ